MSGSETIGPMQKCRRDSIERWYPRLLKSALNQMPQLVKDRCSPEDFVQDTILIGLIHWSKTDGRDENEITAWLMLILRNRIRMEIRRCLTVRGGTATSRIRNYDQDYLESICERRDDEDRPNPLEETLELLNREIESLPDQMRQVVLWRHFEHRDFEWIGERLRISSRQARRRHDKAIKLLLKNCSPFEPVEEKI